VPKQPLAGPEQNAADPTGYGTPISGRRALAGADGIGSDAFDNHHAGGLNTRRTRVLERVHSRLFGT